MELSDAHYHGITGRCDLAFQEVHLEVTGYLDLWEILSKSLRTKKNELLNTRGCGRVFGVGGWGGVLGWGVGGLGGAGGGLRAAVLFVGFE